MKKNLGETRSSQSVLAGGLLGLRGSPSYDKLVHDASKSTNLLARSDRNIDKLLEIFEKNESVAQASMNVSTIFLSNSSSKRQYLSFL